VVKGKAKKLTNSQKIAKPTTVKKTRSTGTTAKAVTKAAGSKAKAQAAKPAPVEAKRGRGRPKREPGMAKGLEGKKTKVTQVIPPVGADEGGLGKGTSDLDMVETSLPDEIDTELDIEVEADGDITLDALTTELDDAPDALDVDDLTDNFDDDDFAEDLADEADEDLDLTEDLSEELGTEKFFRETEPHAEDDEEEIPRSW
jgi:hypothetical protein